MNNAQVQVWSAADLRTGLTAVFERDVQLADIDAFAALSGDFNPLHVDETYARQTNYGNRIVHGAFQVALASTMAGMYLPGRNVVVGSFQARFPAPLYAPSLVQVRGEIVGWLPAARTGMLRVTVLVPSRSTLTAEIMVSFGLHEQPGEARTATSDAVSRAPRGDRPLVIVTGAGGALGSELAASLADSYQIVAIARAGGDVSCDLEQPGWEAILDAAVGEDNVYGIVHAAWPGAPKGGLLDAEPEIVARQVQFGSAVTIGLANWLGRHSKGEGRIVALSSTAASLKPVVGLAAYSLGKAALEHAVRLLAPELARKNITINAVAPSFMPLGMNRTSTSRAVLSESAKVPAGRLCTPQDVLSAIRYLLSREASFVTGQIFPLTGGQL